MRIHTDDTRPSTWQQLHVFPLDEPDHIIDNFEDERCWCQWRRERDLNGNEVIVHNRRC